MQITDSDYYPLPVENRDLELKAEEIAYHIRQARKYGHWQAASMLEARLGKVAQKAEGGSREKIEGIQSGLHKHMLRLMGVKTHLRVITNENH